MSLPDPAQASFPVQQARTRRFTLGRPRAFTVSPDGGRVLFLRSAGAYDPVTSLWSLDVGTGAEQCLADARQLLGAASGGADVPAEERARRERARELADGIVAYATDHDVDRVAFALGGRLYSLARADPEPRVAAIDGAVFDPRPDPTGRRIAFTVGGTLQVLDLDGGGAARTVAAEDGVTWGLAEFVAAEEMQRDRGFWWSPDGRWLAAARVDEREVPVWRIADPASPWQPPAEQRYPAAGTVNADVRLAVFEVVRDDDPATAGERRIEVRWDRDAFPYLAQVAWSRFGPLTLLVQTRDQRRWQVVTVDHETGATAAARDDRDDAWLDIVPGTPAWLPDGRLLAALDTAAGPGGTRALVADDDVVTPAGLQVRSVAAVDASGVWFTASPDPTTEHVYRLDPSTGDVDQVTDAAGVHAAAVGGATVVMTSATLEAPAAVTARVTGDGRDAVTVASHAAIPVVTPEVQLLELGPRRLRAALLHPRSGPFAADDEPLPVLLDPYGGPHAQRVVQAGQAFLTSQWFADQGFAVLVVDGRGTPGRGPEWERAVRGDLATAVLEDQVDALHAAAAEPGSRLDLARVGIRGWSFGGYLAALAVLRRPDVFHAAVAGAPVTDWRLYDTHYTERYLGHPDAEPAAYRASSLVDGDGGLIDAAPPPAGRPPPQLLLVHGLADDNVVAAHTLRLSGALLAAGRPHRFLPLTGVTHMTPQEVVAEKLLTLQVDFLREALGAGAR